MEHIYQPDIDELLQSRGFARKDLPCVHSIYAIYAGKTMGISVQRQIVTTIGATHEVVWSAYVETRRRLGLPATVLGARRRVVPSVIAAAMEISGKPHDVDAAKRALQISNIDSEKGANPQ